MKFSSLAVLHVWENIIVKTMTILTMSWSLESKKKRVHKANPDYVCTYDCSQNPHSIHRVQNLTNIEII
jgi:predicted SprT family Zn-dependent metalloprotease